jgi:hypothetical protein
MIESVLGPLPGPAAATPPAAPPAAEASLIQRLADIPPYVAARTAGWLGAALALAFIVGLITLALATTSRR